MTESLDKLFLPTHTVDGVPIMRNPDRTGPSNHYVDEAGNLYHAGVKKVAIYTPPPAAVVRIEPKKPVAVSAHPVGEVIRTDHWIVEYARAHSPNGVNVTREAAAAALRACAWPDSAAPCGHAGNSNDDDATFESYDSNGDCIVKLFMRGKGYFKVRIPQTMFLEIVDE